MGKKSRQKAERKAKGPQIKDGYVVCLDCGLEQRNPTPNISMDGEGRFVTACTRCGGIYARYALA